MTEPLGGEWKTQHLHPELVALILLLVKKQVLTLEEFQATTQTVREKVASEDFKATAKEAKLEWLLKATST
jgi:hypothetical protein